MKSIEIQILAQDVNNAKRFSDNNNCILATAIKRQLNTTNVGTGVTHSYIDDEHYYHDEEYGTGMYNKDIILARNAPDDTLIRTVLMKKDEC
jgi:hypothetical protein